MKIRPVEAELFHADGWTDMRKLKVAFRNSANAPKKVKPQKETDMIIDIKNVKHTAQ
jgi:hypothetical protein